MFGSKSNLPIKTFKIVVTMINGQQFSFSLGPRSGKKMESESSARDEFNWMIRDLKSISADDGTVVMTDHIVSSRMEEY